MKFKIKSNNNNINNSIIFVVIKHYILYVSISMLSVLMVSADEENPKSNNSANIFKQSKTDRGIGEDCLGLTPNECSRAMHLTCHMSKCDCDEGYQKAVNDTCISEAAKSGIAEYFKSPMLPILIVLGIMFIGICVVLHLFSRARFRKSRSIFVNPQILKIAKAQERRASQLSQMSHNGGGLRSPTGSYTRSPRNSFAAVSPTHSFNGRPHCYGNHALDPKRSPHSPHSPRSSRSRSNSTSSLQMHLRA